ncbi:MAG: transporter substrate-binding domain-containing protein [Anaerovorax sp.]|nr:transporter substrate-binding domain-containing protein [Anaerovorax sp.]
MAEKEKYLEENKGRTFVLGVDPYSGMEYFDYNGKEEGYIIPLMDYISKDLGINIKIDTRSWSEIYQDLLNGHVDILFAANESEERKKWMAFTKPVYKNSYAIITKDGSTIQTIGDIDHKKVGFLKDDIIIELLPKLYSKINYQKFVFDDKKDGVEAVHKGLIDAFVTAGGAVIYDYIYTYPDLKYVFKINKINSELTFSTRKEDAILAEILNDEIESIEDNKLKEFIRENEIKYYRKIMNLNEDELNYLNQDGKAVFGITKDYLPFDYYIDGKYLGISAEIIKEIGNKTGITFIYVYDDFDTLYEKLKQGEIDILNIAKTEERSKHIIFPRAFSKERDIIVGRKDSLDVRDIFGLEDKKVAVINGFWHKEVLEKNLVNVNIIETNNIMESLNLVSTGKADYLIENPTVVRYYIDELELFNLCEKGVTNSDSYLYYGVNKDKVYLASIIDKVIPLLDIEELSKTGYSEIPHRQNIIKEERLVFIISGMAIMLILLGILTYKIKKDLMIEKRKTELLNAREELLYTDTLTNLKNRNHYLTKVRDIIDEKIYPQILIIADLNNLKVVNDKYGHQLGDELLKLFSRSLHQILPKSAYLYRYGGDEFYIILFEESTQSAEHLIVKIREYLNENPIVISEEEQLIPSVAFGYSYRENNKKSIVELEKEADSNMYADKKRIKEEGAAYDSQNAGREHFRF